MQTVISLEGKLLTILRRRGRAFNGIRERTHHYHGVVSYHHVTSLLGITTPAKPVILQVGNYINQALPTPAYFVPFVAAVGMGIGPPGESACRAVRISTPVSVTNNVCSVDALAAV